jgi:hypothetical protein
MGLSAEPPEVRLNRRTRLRLRLSVRQGGARGLSSSVATLGGSLATRRAGGEVALVVGGDDSEVVAHARAVMVRGSAWVARHAVGPLVGLVEIEIPGPPSSAAQTGSRGR